MKSFVSIFSLLLLLCSVGCQQRMSSKLQGRWQGSPDSAARRAEREAKKYGDEPAEPGASEKKEDSVQVTDWESYDVIILMDFVNDKRLEMSLDGEQTQAGTWKIVSTTPAGCMIEVQTKPLADDSDKEAPERRRFDLLLDDRDGVCVGFQLTETGADAQLGALYFRRPNG